MTKFKKVLALGTMVFAIGATSLTVFAASNDKTPAEIVAGLTGKTVESIIAEKTETGKTYGTIASDAGKLKEFKTESLENKKAILAEKVAEGTMTQEEADQISAALEENQATCDGTGTAKIGQKLGAGFGGMNGKGQGRGNGQGKAQGTGLGRGQGNCGAFYQAQ